jgi:catechol 2,3-dioxygenase-like lactoylglutathione lyase family enzyme
VSVLGLDHVSVSCADLERSLAFYHGVLGIPVRDRGRIVGGALDEVLGTVRAAAEYADLELGEGRTLELLAYAEPAGAPLAPAVRRPGAGHLSLRVDDVDALCAAIQAAGFRTMSPGPVTLGDPGFWQGARLVYAIDPDGVAVELIQWPPRAP